MAKTDAEDLGELVVSLVKRTPPAMMLAVRCELVLQEVLAQKGVEIRGQRPS